MKVFVQMYFLTLLTLSSMRLYGLEYGLFAKHDGCTPVKIVSVISEKCSGSHYLEQLITLNTNLINDPFILRHYPPWYSLGAEEYLGKPRHYTFADTDDHLFIILFRNPYDWVRSLHGKPFHAAESLVKIPFSQFIRTPWDLNTTPQVQAWREFFPKIDRHPINGTLFKNVLKLRTSKIQNMLMIKSRANNVYILNYELARDNPIQVLEELRHHFDLSMNEVYTPVVNYKGREDKPVYQEKEYPQISKEDLNFINSQLDPTVEESIGYQLTQD